MNWRQFGYRGVILQLLFPQKDAKKLDLWLWGLIWVISSHFTILSLHISNCSAITPRWWSMSRSLQGHLEYGSSLLLSHNQPNTTLHCVTTHNTTMHIYKNFKIVTTKSCHVLWPQAREAECLTGIQLEWLISLCKLHAWFQKSNSDISNYRNRKQNAIRQNRCLILQTKDVKLVW